MNKISESKRFLGVGWKFPPSLDNTKNIRISKYEEDIKEAIKIILGTAKGERVMRPDFGCGIHEHVFDIVNVSTIGQIKLKVFDALEKWEPRIIVSEVTVSTEKVDVGQLLINVNYLVRTTNNQFNLVYPLYLTEGTRGESSFKI